MRLATIELAGKSRLAVMEGDRFVPVTGVASVSELLRMDAGARSGALAKREGPIADADAKLLAPVRPHKNVFCVGRNYLAHAEESFRARGETVKLPPVPTFFTKAPTAIADPEATLRLQSAVSTMYDWEAELGVVIGTRCKDVPESRALDVVFGYTCVNDISARDVQNATTQFFKGKTLDDTCPIGPWVVTADEVRDPQALDVTCRVNGVQKQHASTSSMIFNVARIIAELSKGTTLEPGDIIATGTPEGVGMGRTPQEWFADGDVVEVEIGSIGVLRNRLEIR